MNEDPRVARLRRQLERTARQLPRLRQMIEYSEDLMFLLDHLGVVVDCNRASTEQLGYARDGLFGLHVALLTVPDDPLPGSLAGLAPGQHQRVRTTLVRQDGTTFPAELNVNCFADAGEVSLVAVGRDITESLALEGSNRQLERMVAVGELATGVAHELNNPLAYAAMSLLFLTKHLDEPSAPIAEALDDLSDALNRVRRVVTDLGTFSQKSEPTVVAEPGPALRAALDMVRNQIRHRAQLEVSLPELPPVPGDQSALSQVFVGLLLNAAEAIEPGAASANRIAVTAQRRGEAVVVEIEDTGVGIPPDDLPRVFEPFFTTKGLTSGSGLGLARARQAVLGAGGTLELASKLDRGTRATVRLPIAALPAAAPDPSLPPTPLRLLVIDDEERLGRALVRMLGRVHEAVAVTSGADALELLADGAAFDAVLCDVMMPELDGRAVYEALRLQAPEVARRTVFMTGGALSESTQRFLAQPGIRWLRKPFEPDDALRALASLR